MPRRIFHRLPREKTPALRSEEIDDDTARRPRVRQNLPAAVKKVRFAEPLVGIDDH